MTQIEITNADYISFSKQDPSPFPTGEWTSDSCFGDMNGHAADNRKKQVKRTPLQVCYPCFKSKKKKYSDEAVPYTQNYRDHHISRPPNEDISKIRHRPFEQDMKMNTSSEYNAGTILRDDEPLIYTKNEHVFRVAPIVESGNHPQKTDTLDRFADYEYSEPKPSNRRIFHDQIKTQSSSVASLRRKDGNQIKHTKNPNDASLPINSFPNSLDFKYKFNPWFTDEIDEMIRPQQVSLVNSYSSSLGTDKQNAWVDEETEAPRINAGGCANELTIPSYSTFGSPRQNYKHKKITWQSDESISFMIDLSVPIPQIKIPIDDRDGRDDNGGRVNIEPVGPMKLTNDEFEKPQSKYIINPDKSMSYITIGRSKDDYKIEKINLNSDKTISFMSDMLSPEPIHNQDDRNYEYPVVDYKTSITLGESVEISIDLPSLLLLKDENDTINNVNDLPTMIGEQNAGLLYNSPRAVVKPSGSLKKNQKQIATPINVDKYDAVINLLGGISLTPVQPSPKPIDSDKDEITAYDPHQKMVTSKPSKRSTNSTPKSQSLNNITRHVPLPNNHKTKIPVTSDRGTYIGPITQSFKTLPQYRAREKRPSGQGNDINIEMTVIHEQAPRPPIPKEIPVAQPNPPPKEIKNKYSNPKPKDIPKFECEPVVRPPCPPFHPTMFNAENKFMSRKTLGTFGNEIVRSTFPMFCKNDLKQSSKENYDVPFQQKHQDCIVVQSSDNQLRDRVKQFDQYSKHGYSGHQNCNDLPNKDHRLYDGQAHTTQKRQDCSNNATIIAKSYRYIKDIFGVLND